MDNTQDILAPIAVDFVVEQGLQEKTEAKRRPYIALIRRWAEREGRAELGERLAAPLVLASGAPKLDSHLIDLTKKYRDGERLQRLVNAVRDLDERIKVNYHWTWAHVMRVLMDEGVLMTNIPNRFDRLVCSMIPGKGIDNVRKNGDYDMINGQRSWRNWIEDYSIDWNESNNRSICKEIFDFLAPVLS
jgi:hypothetical protein